MADTLSASAIRALTPKKPEDDFSRSVATIYVEHRRPVAHTVECPEAREYRFAAARAADEHRILPREERMQRVSVWRSLVVALRERGLGAHACLSGAVGAEMRR